MFRVPAYYNENDKFAAAWLRELIKEGVIAPGDVDERDIRDVVPNELRDYTQWHLFAGISGWSYALRLANWPDSRPVLTLSCPCQPYSSAGKGAGFADERHLWPAAFHIIHGLRDKIPTIFGEQVSSAVNHGWWDLVADDLEGIDYEVWAKDFPACSVGAFHKRQRLYFVANAERSPAEPGRVAIESREGDGTSGTGTPVESGRCGDPRVLADTPDIRCLERWDAPGVALQGECAVRSGEHEADGHAGELSGRSERLCGVGGHTDDGVAHAERQQEYEEQQRPEVHERGRGADRVGGRGVVNDGPVGESDGPRPLPGNGAASSSRHGNPVVPTSFWFDDGGVGDSEINGHEGEPIRADREPAQRVAETSFWSGAVWLPCRDSKLRPVERATKPSPEQISNGLFNDLGYMCDASGDYFFSPLIEKAKNRVGRLRGYGNAIVPQVAAEFIRAFLTSRR